MIDPGTRMSGGARFGRAMARVAIASLAWIAWIASAAAQGATGEGWRQGQEQIDGGTLLVVAYMALWVILLLFVLRIASRQRSLKADIEELRRNIEDRGT